VFEHASGLVLRPEIAALATSGSSFLVAVNALLQAAPAAPLQNTPPGAQAACDFSHR
jgi:Cu2+-exporting ATPase